METARSSKCECHLLTTRPSGLSSLRAAFCAQAALRGPCSLHDLCIGLSRVEMFPMRNRLMRPTQPDTQANSIMLGWEVHHMSSNLEISAGLTTFSIIFAFWFIVEVLVRLRVVGFCSFFCNDDYIWNMCDLGLVCVSIVELFLLFAGTSKTPFSSIKATYVLAKAWRCFRRALNPAGCEDPSRCQAFPRVPLLSTTVYSCADGG